MAGLFDRTKKPAGVPVINTVDGVTGEVTSMKTQAALTIPDMSTVTEISAVAGANPEMVNLRDHPELAGMRFLIQRARFTNGMIDGRTTDFVILEGFIFPPGQQPTEDNRVLVSTGADNIYQRVAAAFAADALPIIGTLRYAGRARFLD